MRQELFHHANRPAQIDFNLSSDVFEASSFVVNIDLTHDAGVVDQNVELRKLFGDLFVKRGDRFRIGNVASKGVNFWKGRFRTVHLSLIAARDKNRVTKCRELFREFVTDTAATAGDQNRIAREFHNCLLILRPPPERFAGAGLIASALPIMSASIFRAREAGTRAFMMRFSRPGIILDRFSRSALRPSDTHCSTLIGFNGMVFGSKPNFSSTSVFVNPAASTVTHTPRGLNS